MKKLGWVVGVIVVVLMMELTTQIRGSTLDLSIFHIFNGESIPMTPMVWVIPPYDPAPQDVWLPTPATTLQIFFVGTVNETEPAMEAYGWTFGGQQPATFPADCVLYRTSSPADDVQNMAAVCPGGSRIPPIPLNAMLAMMAWELDSKGIIINYVRYDRKLVQK